MDVVNESVVVNVDGTGETTLEKVSTTPKPVVNADGTGDATLEKVSMTPKPVVNAGGTGGQTLKKVSTTPKPKRKPKPAPKAKAKAEGTAKKVRQYFYRQNVKEDVLSDSIQNLDLNDATPTPVLNFDDMNLKPELLKAILEKGLEKPAFCQQNVIMPMINGRDVICQAQSGMGKTAAFCISVLQRLDVNDPMCKTLVLAPTRELAEQILDEFTSFAKHMKQVICISCIGGGSRYKKNLRQVSTGKFHIAVGTLGRMAHLFCPGFDDRGDKQKGLNGDSVKTFVIDEADKMIMCPSFKGDLKFMFRQLSGTAQLIVTSATMPSVAFDRCNDVMRNPFKFLLRNEQLTLDGIRQFHVKVGTEEGKLTTLDELFPFLKQTRGITFCNSRKKAQVMAKKMKDRNHAEIEGMTGTMEQGVRKQILNDFKSGRTPVLIASDLLGRGIHVHHVQLVVNFDLPATDEEYIHRIGRTGRYGKKGIAISFVTDGEVSAERIKRLEEFYQTEIPELRASLGDLINELN